MVLKIIFLISFVFYKIHLEIQNDILSYSYKNISKEVGKMKQSVRKDFVIFFLICNTVNVTLVKGHRKQAVFLKNIHCLIF